MCASVFTRWPSSPAKNFAIAARNGWVAGVGCRPTFGFFAIDLQRRVFVAELADGICKFSLPVLGNVTLEIYICGGMHMYIFYINQLINCEICCMEHFVVRGEGEDGRWL